VNPRIAGSALFVAPRVGGAVGAGEQDASSAATINVDARFMTRPPMYCYAWKINQRATQKQFPGSPNNSALRAANVPWSKSLSSLLTDPVCSRTAVYSRLDCGNAVKLCLKAGFSNACLPSRI
jgi:hypothetical protein